MHQPTEPVYQQEVNRHRCRALKKRRVFSSFEDPDSDDDSSMPGAAQGARAHLQEATVTSQGPNHGFLNSGATSTTIW